ncbi:MAG: carbon storage regulator [Deltaproteobacteria bacterium]
MEPGIEIAVVEVRGGRVRIGVEAPDDIRIRRVESPSDSGFGARNGDVPVAARSKSGSS